MLHVEVSDTVRAPRQTVLDVYGDYAGWRTCSRRSAACAIRLKGWARLLRPFLPGYARRLIRRLQVEPVKAEAEARAQG